MYKPCSPRLAYCSPVNPAASGIADYSEELLPYLAQYANVTLYVADRLRPSSAALGQHLEVQPLRRLARQHRRRPYDAILFHMGNSPAHADIWREARRLPALWCCTILCCIILCCGMLLMLGAMCSIMCGLCKHAMAMRVSILRS